ncbi:MAG: CopY family transcriptional regulator [Spirulina sp. DLM2.Bin59]|nr:MAG: CopY family transcriptional regulator [Spirulina sp. DLM2.Bin59]
MSAFHRPQQMSLGPLETEILELLWDFETATVKTIHDRILSDPQRELAYTSVTTVLQRLTQKGWVQRQKVGRSFQWRACLSRTEAQALRAQEHLQQFLGVSNPDVVAAFADRLDQASVAQLDELAQRLKAARAQRGEG